MATRGNTTAKQAPTGGSSMEGSDDIVFVGVDDGHDSIKLVARALDSSKDVAKLNLPSKVVRGSRSVSLTGDGAGGGVYVADGEHFTVTDALVGSDTIDTRAVGYATHAINRVLVNDALVQAGLGGRKVRIVTGLPVSDYYLNDEVNTDVIDKKKANIISTDIKPVSANVRLADIVDHGVACEAIAAVYDMAIREDGTDNEEFFDLLDTAPVGVIDIGGKTIDLAVAYRDRNTVQVDMRRTNSINYGMLRMSEVIKREIMRSHSVDDISPRSMFKIIQNKQLFFAGQNVDVSKEVQKAIAQMVPDLFDRVRSHWGTASDLAKVIVIGGGAYLLGKEIKDGLYQHAETRIKDPEFANARGMLKLAMRKYLQTKS